MPTLAQLRNTIDARLATLWTDVILPREQAYLTRRGRYWQGIATCDRDALPDNTDAEAIKAVSADYTRRPTDQAESWADELLDLGASPPLALQIDIYGGVHGHGFVATVYVRHAGRVFSRAKGYGPEDRDQAWHELVEQAL